MGSETIDPRMFEARRKAAGASVSDIATATGLSYTTVWNIEKSFRIGKPRRLHHLTARAIDAAISRYEAAAKEKP
jgi:transcriptional regulator with XRE-family HTH domain